MFYIYMYVCMQTSSLAPDGRWAGSGVEWNGGARQARPRGEAAECRAFGPPWVVERSDMGISGMREGPESVCVLGYLPNAYVRQWRVWENRLRHAWYTRAWRVRLVSSEGDAVGRRQRLEMGCDGMRWDAMRRDAMDGWRGSGFIVCRQWAREGMAWEAMGWECTAA